MNTTENNKLIAEFMGQHTMIWNDPDPIAGNDYRVVYFKQLCDETALIQYGLGEYNSEAEVYLNELENVELNYHTSWDWLMPVVHKIVADYEFNEQEELSDNEYRESLMDIVPFGIISDVYESVVEFIKWYNENKEN